MRSWQFLTSSEPVSPALLDVAGGRLLLAKLLAQRGFNEPNEAQRFLDHHAYTPSPPEDLPDLVVGVDRLLHALKKKERILVWGDFDVDGQTSTALLVSAFRQAEGVVDYHIPLRATESHGIRPDVLQEYLDEGIDLIITCDTGIMAHDAIQLANEAGVDVIITDHHDLGDTLPPAFAVINPKRLDESHPLATLPGVGVAFKVIEALFLRLGKEAEVDSFLDLVALGLVADLALLTGDARYLLQRGLEVLRQNRRPGIAAILSLARVDARFLVEEDIGFTIAPRMNAVGRLGDANIAVPLLTTEDPKEAKEIAKQLESLNVDRKLLTEQVFEGARAQLEAEPSLLNYAALVLAHPMWHPGVIGLVATRLVDTYGKPTVLLATPGDGVARGSARSIEGYHVTQAIASQADMLYGFGGHPMAAGLSMPAEHLERFRSGISKNIIEQRAGGIPKQFLEIAAEVSLADLTLELAEDLECLAPFGAGNPPVYLVCRGIEIAEVSLFGRDQTHRKVLVRDAQGNEQMIYWWRSAHEPVPEGLFDLVVRIRPNHFNNEYSARITWEDHRAGKRYAAGAGLLSDIAVADYRMVDDKEAALASLLDAEPSLQVWGEGPGIPAQALSRDLLDSAPKLGIWTTPPDQQTLLQILKQVQPVAVYVFGVTPELDDLDAFSRRLGGLAKYVLEHYEGRISIGRLAAAMALAPATVRLALPWLATLGVEAEESDEGEVTMRLGAEQLSTFDRSALEHHLKEVRAFRTVFEKTEELEGLFQLIRR